MGKRRLDPALERERERGRSPPPHRRRRAPSILYMPETPFTDREILKQLDEEASEFSFGMKAVKEETPQQENGKGGANAAIKMVVGQNGNGNGWPVPEAVPCYEDLCSELMCYLDDCPSCKGPAALGTGDGECHGLGRSATCPAADATAAAVGGSVAKEPPTWACPGAQEVQHEHSTFFDSNGVEYNKCTRTVKKCPSEKCKKGNRLAVQKYRLKKKQELENLKTENDALKARVKELESKFDTFVDSVKQESTAELVALREMVSAIRGIVKQ